MGTVCDVLRMKKNICLCRHFHLLNKSEIAGNIKQNRIKYIDVWPVNVFEPHNDDPFDVVSLFMMQLACIINMLPVWKNLHLRLFLCETENINGSSRYVYFVFLLKSFTSQTIFQFSVIST